jgi:hypothetical protein
MPEYNFTWVNEAPITPVSTTRATTLAKTLGNNVKNWLEHFTPGADRKSGIPTQAQIDGTTEMCDVIWRSQYRGKEEAFAYEICGAPVAILVVTTNQEGWEYVDALVTHPAADFAGSIMIEFVLTRAAKASRQPVVKLMPLTKNSVEAFKGMGFVEDGMTGRLKLDPREASDKWKEVGKNEWKFLSRRSNGAKYLETVAATATTKA